MAISRQNEAQSHNYTLYISNDFKGSYNAQYHRQHSALQAFEQFERMTEWAIGAGQYYIASSLHLLENVFW